MLNFQRTKLTKDGNLSFSFTTDSSLYLNLSHGEYTSMYVMPGDNIELSLNTDEFDESVNYKMKRQTSWQKNI